MRAAIPAATTARLAARSSVIVTQIRALVKLATTDIESHINEAVETFAVVDLLLQELEAAVEAVESRVAGDS